ncbi:MAG: hypothetical protein PHO02_01515 [Candidatus Nanoarchaeia archaeon]|nr:hypothetical protein [Candidatus Nanoarchaeia archaeon]
MNPKGQITIFVALGIAIITLVVIGYYFVSSSQMSAAETEAEIASKLPADVAEVRKEVSECIQYTLEDAIVQAGMFGGYTEPRQNALFTGTDFVNYAMENKKKTLPLIEEVQNNIESYIETYAYDCVDTENDKFKITLPAPKAKVDISSKKVYAEVEFRIALKAGDSTFTFSEPFAAESSVRLLELYNAADKIADKTAESPENINVDYLLTLGEEVDVIPFDEKNVIYRIPDKSVILRSELGNMNFAMVFATKA